MFYPKKLKTKKISYYKLNFGSFNRPMTTDVDDSVMSHTLCKRSFNFDFEDASLSDGIGFEKLTLPTSSAFGSFEREIRFEPYDVIEKLWVFKHYVAETGEPIFFLQYFSNEEIRETGIFSISPYTNSISSFTFPTVPPLALNYKLNGEDVMIFSSKDYGLWLHRYLYMATKISDDLCFKSWCLHYERVFAILDDSNKTRLRFSDDFDITNWEIGLEEGGFIDMPDERGPLNKVISFNDYVYIFRDFGVSRLSAYGDQTQFSVSHLFVSSSKLYGETVCVCGDRIMLLTTEGLHIFDGYSTKKIDLGIDKLFEGVDNLKARAIFAEGKYYVACKLNFDDGLDEEFTQGECDGYNNALIEYDVNNGHFSITRGISIVDLFFVNTDYVSKIVACFANEPCNRVGQLTRDGKFFGNVLKKYWTSPFSNLGFPAKKKFIKQFLIKTNSNCEVCFKTENTQKSYLVKAGEKSQKINTNVVGEQIAISFVSTSENTKICLPQIIVGVES